MFSEKLVSGVVLYTLHNLSQLILTTIRASILYSHLTKNKNTLSQLRYFKKSIQDQTAGSSRI